MSTVRLACQAMATRFELVLQGEDEVRLRAAGEEALTEIRRLEARLSFYSPTSEVSRINARAAEAPVPIAPDLFRLIEEAGRFHHATEGAFDVTVGPLMRCWGFVGGSGALPDPAAVADARSRVGMHLVALDDATRTVRFLRPGMSIDLGAIGKGYAVEQAVAVLRELGVEHALLHGGTSTIQALGRQQDGEPWRVAIERPDSTADGSADDVLAVVELEDASLSVSAVSGKSFTAGGRVYGHVLDPRLGAPVQGAVLGAVVSDTATETDALSTALLTVDPWRTGLPEWRTYLPMLVVGEARPGRRAPIATRGIEVRPHGPEHPPTAASHRPETWPRSTPCRSGGAHTQPPRRANGR